MNEEERLRLAIINTQVLRAPKQMLATFGLTNIEYYLVTQPAYAENETQETVVRQGRVVASQPRIVTPYYLSQAEGFSPEARDYLHRLMAEHGPNAPGIYYTYRNEPGSTEIITDSLYQVVNQINQRIEAEKNGLATIIKGDDQLWDVSLLKFIIDMTNHSSTSNALEMNHRGLLKMDSSGLPLAARLQIEEMFNRLSRGEINPTELRNELKRWGLFDEYQDRFFSALRRN